MSPDELEEIPTADLIERARALRAALGRRVRQAHQQRAVKVQRGAPVAGTGALDKGTNPYVQVLIADARKAGAGVTKARDGHYRVEYQGRSANISATPRGDRAVKNDRARLRRKLGLKV